MSPCKASVEDNELNQEIAVEILRGTGFMTANAFDEDKENTLAAGMNEHISKPIELSKLIGTLTQILP